MGIQILPQEGSFASQFGSGVGQGLSQQLPEEIKRYRLKSGLENLANQKSTKSPYELIASLATIPGIDPGLIGVLAPALHSQIQRNESAGIVPQGATGVSIAPGNIAASSPGIATAGSPREDLSQKLFSSQPFNYPTLDKAESKATELINNYSIDFEKFSSSFLQKGKLEQEGEVGGALWKELEQKGIDELSSTNRKSVV